MGVDVHLFAKGRVSDEVLKAAEEFMQERSHGGWGPGETLLERIAEESHDYIHLIGGDRYYGPGYERGWWPSIYNDIVCLQAALPGCTVHYGTDSEDCEEVEEATQEVLKELWDHWLSPNGLDYRSRWNKMGQPIKEN